MASASSSVLIVAVLASMCACSRAQTPKTAVPADFFGNHLILKSDWFQVSTGALGKATEVTWPYVEANKGKYDWNNLDEWVSTAQDHGMKLFYSFAKVPPWAAADPKTCSATYPGSHVLGCTSTVANVADWDRFVTALVQRYKGKMIWELWNEPDSFFTGTYDQLITLTKHAHDIIRANDPGAAIISPSFTCPSAEFREDSGCPASLDGFWAHGGTRDVDAVSFHGYPHHDEQIPEAVVNTIGAYQEIMARYGVKVPLWDTEGSWGDASHAVCCQNSGPEQQAAFLARHYLLHWSAGATRYYWYAWDNSGWGTLWTAGQGMNAAGAAYQQVYDWMVGATMTGPCEQSGTTWTCSFIRPNGYRALAVWNLSGDTSYAVPTGYTRYRDLSGGSHPASAKVTIGQRPILIENTTTTTANDRTAQNRRNK